MEMLGIPIDPDYKRCSRCKARVEIDAGSFECVEINPVTGKCAKYVFVCDDCLDKEKPDRWQVNDNQ